MGVFQLVFFSLNLKKFFFVLYYSHIKTWKLLNMSFAFVTFNYFFKLIFKHVIFLLWYPVHSIFKKYIYNILLCIFIIFIDIIIY